MLIISFDTLAAVETHVPCSRYGWISSECVGQDRQDCQPTHCPLCSFLKHSHFCCSEVVVQVEVKGRKASVSYGDSLLLVEESLYEKNLVTDRTCKPI